MSFETVCNQCGATGGPSVGLCPYCKSLMTDSSLTKSESPAYSNLAQLYQDGQIEKALFYVQEVLRSREKFEEDPAMLLLCSKILIESEGPTGRTRALLGTALMNDPKNREINDYLDITEARIALSAQNCQEGIEILEKVLQQSPENPHALFTLGAHYFWHDQNCYSALPYLEKCLRVRPQFLRAWACMATIAKQLGNPQLASSALQKCIALENNASMKNFFRKELESLSQNKKAA